MVENRADPYSFVLSLTHFSNNKLLRSYFLPVAILRVEIKITDLSTTSVCRRRDKYKHNWPELSITVTSEAKTGKSFIELTKPPLSAYFPTSFI